VSRIIVTGVIIAGTAMGTGIAINMGVLDFSNPADNRVTITHVDLATFTAQTVQGSERRGRVPVKIILRLPGLREAQDACRLGTDPAQGHLIQSLSQPDTATARQHS
jgi:hypothetical protein